MSRSSRPPPAQKRERPFLAVHILNHKVGRLAPPASPSRRGGRGHYSPLRDHSRVLTRRSRGRRGRSSVAHLHSTAFTVHSTVFTVLKKHSTGFQRSLDGVRRSLGAEPAASGRFQHPSQGGDAPSPRELLTLELVKTTSTRLKRASTRRNDKQGGRGDGINCSETQFSGTARQLDSNSSNHSSVGGHLNSLRERIYNTGPRIQAFLGSVPTTHCWA